MASGPITSWQIDGETMETLTYLFVGAPKSLQMLDAAMTLKDTYSLAEKLWPSWQHITKQKHYFTNKGPSSLGYGFSNGHVWMWQLDYKESWAQKIEAFECGVGEDSWESLGLQGDPNSQS